MMFGLAHEDVSMWWIAIGMGAVVDVAVIVLLSLLITFVQDIDRNVKVLWNTATRVARNTATSWMLNQTASATASLADETARHAAAFNMLAGASRSYGAPSYGAGTSSNPAGADAPPGTRSRRY